MFLPDIVSIGPCSFAQPFLEFFELVAIPGKAFVPVVFLEVAGQRRVQLICLLWVLVDEVFAFSEILIEIEEMHFSR